MIFTNPTKRRVFTTSSLRIINVSISPVKPLEGRSNIKLPLKLQSSNTPIPRSFVKLETYFINNNFNDFNSIKFKLIKNLIDYLGRISIKEEEG